MPQKTPATVSAFIASLVLLLSACNAGHSQTSHTSTSSISIASTGAALITTTQRQEPSLWATARARDVAAFVAYWKKQGYTVTTDLLTLKPDGTVKTFHFAASRPRKGADKAGTVAVTINDALPPDAGPQAGVKKAPPLSGTSTAKDIAAFMAFFEGHGYAVTRDRQTYHSDGTVQEFRFAAKRGRGARQSSVSADINGATNDVSINVSISEDDNKMSKP